MNTTVKPTPRKAIKAKTVIPKSVDALIDRKYAELNKKMAEVLKNNPNFQP